MNINIKQFLLLSISLNANSQADTNVINQSQNVMTCMKNTCCENRNKIIASIAALILFIAGIWYRDIIKTKSIDLYNYVCSKFSSSTSETSKTSETSETSETSGTPGTPE